jgi:hypothetical protein
VSEVKSPSSFRGWEAIVIQDPELKGVVLSDEYSENLHSSVLTVDWEQEPPECILLQHEDLMRFHEGYLLIPTAGRTIGFIPAPLIHKCGSGCNVRLND